MDGMRIVVPVHFHGTLSADGTFRWVTPCGLTLEHVSIASSVDTDCQVKVGKLDDDDAYLALKGSGDQTAKGYGRADFVDGEYPHIPAGTVLLVTVDYDGSSGTAAQNCSVVLTFSEG